VDTATPPYKHNILVDTDEFETIKPKISHKQVAEKNFTEVF